MADAIDLPGLTARGLSILRLTQTQWDDLRDTKGLGTRFTLTFPHATARGARSRSLVLVAIDTYGPAPDLRLGYLRTIQAIATLDSRVSIDHLQPVHPRRLDLLTDRIEGAALRPHARALALGAPTFEAVSPTLGRRMVETLAADPWNDGPFQRLTALLDRPRSFRNARALQQDAIAMALKAFGAADGAAELDLGRRMTGLAGARLQEDAVIQHDARWLPGWDLAESDLTGRAVFRQARSELQVFTANKQPLEALFGVDLIYLNEARGALVMVQYKMMEPGADLDRYDDEGELQSDTREWLVPIDDQFESELARMRLFEPIPDPAAPYRMSPSPYFFKLVKRNAPVGSAGILMSLGHLDRLRADGQLTGPRGGLRIAYRTLGGHYLRGETFVDLVRSGYIGSHGATTDHLRTLIEATLDGGKAVVAAIQRRLPSRPMDAGDAI